MPSPSPEAFQLAELYRLGLTEPPTRGAAGDRLGRTTGSSLEFQDRRAYVAGDDVRHIDWRAYARTDQLMVRQYREEILPRLDLLVDCSLSMDAVPGKAQATIDLVTILTLACQASGYSVRVIAMGERPEPIPFERLQVEGLEFKSRQELAVSVDQAMPLLRPGTIRVLLSDFLSPHDASALVRPIAASAGGVALIQLLGASDAEPEEGRAMRLTDSETGHFLDLVLDRRTVEGYRERLGRLEDALQTECRRAGGRFISLISSTSLADLCRTRLAAEGLLVPA